MNPLALIAMALGVIGATLVIVGGARRNAGGIRRCPRCRYNLTATEAPRCSECGYEWTSSAELYERSRIKWKTRTGAACIVLAIALGIMAAYSIRDWTNAVPQPILALALSLFVQDQRIPAGSFLPAPDPVLKHSSSRWERLLWQKQTALAVELYLDLVSKSDGSLDDIKRLIPVAIEANELYKEVGGTYSSDAWPVGRAVQRARELQPILDARFDLPLGTWAAFELQFLGGNSDAIYPNWIAPPLEIHEALARSSDPAIRRYALGRLQYLREAQPVLEDIAENDPEPSLRTIAEGILLWQREVRGWR